MIPQLGGCETVEREVTRLENFYCLSLNYKRFTLEQREQLVKDKYHKKIKELCKKGQVVGYVPLMTCLRMEFYFESIDDSISFVEKIFGDYKGLYDLYRGTKAVEYLYQVACGFESVIQGEDEVLSQLKKAFFSASEEQLSSKLINVLMNKAIALGKKIRTVSKISHNTKSLQATVVKELKSQYGPSFKDRHVLIIGLGELAEEIMKLLIGQVKSIVICNRTASRLNPILEEYDVKGIEYKEKYAYIDDSDIIICATAAPHPILYTEEMKSVMPTSKERIFVDLAVPRDIEDGVGSLSGCELINLDDCFQAYNRSLEERENYVDRYYFLVAEQMKKTLEWINYRYKRA